MKSLHITYARDDDVVFQAFRLFRFDRAPVPVDSPRSEVTLVLGDNESLDLGLDLQDLMTEVDEEQMRQLSHHTI